ncbi:MAG: OmpH family outer membrane protein [Bacteroidales bacterium]|jgi:outer membrane protein|nr:OmpH family outer membrane protein [Bacteroidales bacterium]
MKKLAKVLVLLVLALGIGYGANAQTQKIGYVDSQAIIELMPEGAKIQQDLQAYYSELQAELQAMATEYQNKMREYEANQATMSNILRQSKEKEIVDLQGRIQEFQANAENDLAAKQEELSKPMLDKIKAAIDAVVKAKGLAYVFEKTVILSIGDGAIDITADVKTKLGL